MAFTLVLFCHFACSQKPAILRQVFPILPSEIGLTTNFRSVNQASQTRQGLTLNARFLDRVRLYDLALLNYPEFNGDRSLPLLMAFKVELKNEGEKPVEFNLNEAFLQQPDGHRVPVLTETSFRTKYSSVVDQTVQYLPLFEDKLVWEKGAVKKTVFRKGILASGSTAEALLLFPSLDELDRTFTFQLTNVQFQSGAKIAVRDSFAIGFYQKKIRNEEKKR